MRKIIRILLVTLICLGLCGCGQDNTSDNKIITITKNGVDYVIDTEQCTIKGDQQTYAYVIDMSEITIKYSDGQFYTWKEANDIGIGTASPDFDYSAHVDPDILIDVIEEAYQSNSKSNRENVVWGVILIIIGIVDAIWAERVWFLNWGWRYKNAEPSKLAIGLYRVGGIFAAVIGLIVIIVI